MSEEEKILFDLKLVARKHTIEVKDGTKIETLPASINDELRLNNYSAKILLNYIEQKDKEIERLKKKVD